MDCDCTCHDYKQTLCLKCFGRHRKWAASIAAGNAGAGTHIIAQTHAGSSQGRGMNMERWEGRENDFSPNTKKEKKDLDLKWLCASIPKTYPVNSLQKPVKPPMHHAGDPSVQPFETALSTSWRLAFFLKPIYKIPDKVQEIILRYVELLHPIPTNRTERWRLSTHYGRKDTSLIIPMKRTCPVCQSEKFHIHNQYWNRCESCHFWERRHWEGLCCIIKVMEDTFSGAK